MKGKNWLVAGAAVLICGILLTGVYITRAVAAGDPNTNGWSGKMAQNFGSGHHKGNAPGGIVNSVAQFLGMEVPDLMAERQSGKSFAQIAAEKGKSEQELVDYVVGQMTAKIDKLLQDGKITQTQVDQWKQTMAERVKTALNQTEVGPNGFGGYKGKAGHSKGFGRGAGMEAGLGRGTGNGLGNSSCPFNSGS